MFDQPPSYGDTTAEYLAARRAGLVGGLRGLFWVEGPDAVSFLQGILTQDVEAMRPGDVARSMLLEPRGKLVSLLWLLAGDGRVGIVTDRPVLDDTIAALTRWRFRVDAEIRPDSREIVEVWGSKATSTVAEVVSVPDGWAESGSILAAVIPLGPLERVLLAGADPAALQAAGAARIGSIAADTVRLESGEPLMGVDVDGNTIPQESGLVPAAVSFTKGCFLGQELVARIDTRGHVNRRLAGLRLTENILPPLGATVVGADRELGRITSVGESLELRAPIAMGLIRREAQAGTEVSIRWDGGSASAVLVDLPMVGGRVGSGGQGSPSVG